MLLLFSYWYISFSEIQVLFAILEMITESESSWHVNVVRDVLKKVMHKHLFEIVQLGK